MPVEVLQDVVEESGQVADAEWPDVLQHDGGEIVRAHGFGVLQLLDRLLCLLAGDVDQGVAGLLPDFAEQLPEGLCRFGGGWGVYCELSLFAIFLGSL